MEIIPSILSRSLEIAGYPLIELKGKEGGCVFVLPYGARVLGIFTASSNRNCFWVNPELSEADRAEKFFKSSGWKNSGGDRTWVSPEIDLFIRDPKDALNTYEVPESVDPGNYSVEENGEMVYLTNRGELFNHRLNKKCEIELNKTVRAVKNPLRYEAKFEAICRKVKFIGYEQETILKIVSLSDNRIRLGIWNLMQVPAGGEILIPTLCQCSPRDYFEKTGPQHLQVSPNLIRFVVDGKGRHKIGVKAMSLTGRIGYLSPSGKNEWFLIVRNFVANPSGDYIDTPWDDREDVGYAVQCYDDDGSLGDFGEMEYHTPAIGAETGGSEYTDCSQVWAFSGEEKAIREISSWLLGRKGVLET